jgi:hypothetical protein
MYPSMLSFENINKLKLFFECGIPMPQDAGNSFIAFWLLRLSARAGKGLFLGFYERRGMNCLATI